MVPGGVKFTVGDSLLWNRNTLPWKSTMLPERENFISREDAFIM